jgi:hypothetical protein
MAVETVGDTVGDGEMKVARENDHPLKLSHYLQAGSPICCFLPSCRQPFLGRCVHANDGHFYCSGACAQEATGLDLSQVREIGRRSGGRSRS